MLVSVLEFIRLACRLMNDNIYLSTRLLYTDWMIVLAFREEYIRFIGHLVVAEEGTEICN